LQERSQTGAAASCSQGLFTGWKTSSGAADEYTKPAIIRTQAWRVVDLPTLDEIPACVRPEIDFFGALGVVIAIAACALVLKMYPMGPAEAAKDAIEGLKSEAYTWGDTVKFILAIAAAGATVMAWAYQTGSKRLGVVDLFACEIATLCRVGTVVEFIPNMVAQYDLVGAKPKNAPQTEAPAQALRFDSEENYFPVFESNAKDLQILEADVVNNVTAFYTYMKATRDMLRQLSNLRLSGGPAEAERKALVNVIYMVFLAYESARRAIDDLIEFEPTHAENKIVVLFTELPAYRFLRNRFADGEFKDEIRMKRLDLRLIDYQDFVPELCAKVHAHAGAEKWDKAYSLVTGLENEFRLLQKEVVNVVSVPRIAAHAA
jgi:hypothetical protein